MPGRMPKADSENLVKIDHMCKWSWLLRLRDEKGWRATFYTTGMEHSPTSATGTGWERTPWRACGVWRR